MCIFVGTDIVKHFLCLEFEGKYSYSDLHKTDMLHNLVSRKIWIQNVHRYLILCVVRKKFLSYIPVIMVVCDSYAVVLVALQHYAPQSMDVTANLACAIEK